MSNKEIEIKKIYVNSKEQFEKLYNSNALTLLGLDDTEKNLYSFAKWIKNLSEVSNPLSMYIIKGKQMEEKQKINRKTKSEKIFAVIPKDLKERVIRYKAKTNMSESEIVNVALNEFFKVKILKDDMDDIAELMGKAIDSKLGKKFERMIMLIAKAGKSSYASLFLQAYFLSKVCETEESKEFLKEKIELANKLAYGVIKNKFLDEDIRQMIPDDLDFDNMEQ